MAVTSCDLYALLGIDEAELLGPAKEQASHETGLADKFFSALNSLSPKSFSSVAEMRNARLFVRMSAALEAMASAGETFARKVLDQALKKHPAFQKSNFCLRWAESPMDRHSGRPFKVWAFDLAVLTGKPVQRRESGGKRLGRRNSAGKVQAAGSSHKANRIGAWVGI
jgi:hypothetical protein